MNVKYFTTKYITHYSCVSYNSSDSHCKTDTAYGCRNNV